MTETKRTKLCEKVFILADGSESRHASPEVESLEFRLTNGSVHSVKKENVGPDCWIASAWHGLSQKGGDTYAGAKDADEAEDRLAAILERLSENEWIKARESAGPRTSILAEAVKSALMANGETVDDNRFASIAEKLKDKATREGTIANPVIAAEYERIKAERAAQRAEKAKEAAAGQSADLSQF